MCSGGSHASVLLGVKVCVLWEAVPVILGTLGVKVCILGSCAGPKCGCDISRPGWE